MIVQQQKKRGKTNLKIKTHRGYHLENMKSTLFKKKTTFHSERQKKSQPSFLIFNFLYSELQKINKHTKHIVAVHSIRI